MLIDRFRLYRSSRLVDASLSSAAIRAVYESRDPIPLVVIDKHNGGKSDALNAGVSASRSELVAIVDADSLLEQDALLSVLKPFLEDEQVVATGGIVRVANGCTVEKGQVTEVRTPDTLLPLVQTVEYLRAFLGGRVAFSFINSLQVLYRQRNRWQRGTVETIRTHRHLLFNRQYGAMGLFGFPYFALFEMFGPTVESLGYVVTAAGFMLGVISIEVAYLFFMVSILFSIVLSMGAVVLEELTTRRYPSPRDVIKLFGAAVLENFGYRQLMTLWRAKGLLDGLAGKTGWGKMERRGFETG